MTQVFALQTWPKDIQFLPCDVWLQPQYWLLLSASIQANVVSPVLQYVRPAGHKQLPFVQTLPLVH